MRGRFVKDSLLGLYILLPRLDSGKYFVFLQEVISELLAYALAPVRPRMWFLQDEALSHYEKCTRDHLDWIFPNGWIGWGSPITWPPRSPDLSPLGFFSGEP
ncbi:uncharacterized protein TNCV_1731091 [Trichonephila clavipes]|nr:uncharacterized protein TNCV_1731091 [Trichonephila clavipes]